MFSHLYVKEERVSPPNTSSTIMESYQENQKDSNVQISVKDSINQLIDMEDESSQSDEYDLLKNDKGQPVFIKKQDYAMQHRHEERSILLITLLKETQRLYAGLNYIIEYQDKNFDSSEARYFCKLCLGPSEKQEIRKHCTSFTHIFRFFKTYMPKEYERIAQRDVKERVDIIKNIIEIYHNRVFKNFKPKLKLLNNLDKDYYDEIDSIFESEPVEIEDTVELSILNDHEEEVCSIRNESIFSNIKRCTSPTSHRFESKELNNKNQAPPERSSDTRAQLSSSNEKNNEIEFVATTSAAVTAKQSGNFLSHSIVKSEPCDFEELPASILQTKRKNDNSNLDTYAIDNQPDIKRLKYDNEHDEINAIINDIIDDKPNVKFDKHVFFKIKNNMTNLNLSKNRFNKLLIQLEKLLTRL